MGTDVQGPIFFLYLCLRHHRLFSQLHSDLFNYFWGGQPQKEKKEKEKDQLTEQVIFLFFFQNIEVLISWPECSTRVAEVN